MSLELVLFDYLNEMKRAGKNTILNLGGASGAGGGIGGGTVGYNGKLPQTRVAYDETEAEDNSITVSGGTLVDNLNHIRYRINVLEAQIIVSAAPPGSPSVNDLWVDIS